ncbi:hypothetical protein CJF31_00001198 [Rutstroemia sp. NJR-2017a BVV2]|nr:hypothetical protein CJF31_00001198 [Rutstroemia sp. NJR-2017a BVV2]
MPIVAQTTKTTAAAESTTAAADSATGALPDLSSVAASESASESAAAAASTSTTASSDTTQTGTSTTGTVAVITGGSTGGSTAAATGLPTLAGAFSIPTPTVPPTANAPFMKMSNYPEGTVFIVVGAILGFLALCVLSWRMLIAWSLHRSVKRAAMHQNMVDQKVLFQNPGQPFYKYADKESTISLGGMGKSGKKGRPTTANAPVQSQSSLFFSPTAHAGGNNAGNRASSYLPAGYYAAGASAPANGQSTAHLGDRQSISMSNLAPSSSYLPGHSMGPSPPGSPGYAPHSDYSSQLDLNRGGGGGDGNVRAPSAYLDDLFDGDGPLPPPQHGGDRRSTRY